MCCACKNEDNEDNQNEDNQNEDYEDEDNQNEDSCQDTDNGAKDPYNDGCEAYTLNPGWCGGYDDEDFQSEIMCCACKNLKWISKIVIDIDLKIKHYDYQLRIKVLLRLIWIIILKN